MVSIYLSITYGMNMPKYIIHTVDREDHKKKKKKKKQKKGAHFYELACLLKSPIYKLKNCKKASDYSFLPWEKNMNPLALALYHDMHYF